MVSEAKGRAFESLWDRQLPGVPQPMAVITINGKRVEVTGSNVSINNGVISVDGVTVEGGLQGVVRVE